jgi:peptide/nickel transport system permease protein
VAAYLARRLVFAAFLIFAVSSSSLLLVQASSGDYVTEALGVDADPATAAALRARYGLDQPRHVQYWTWLMRAARFDFGWSLAYDRPVADLIPERAINSAILAGTALLVATLIGLPLGVLTSSRPAGVVNGVVGGGSIILLSMPPLLTSLFLVFLAARTGWLPMGGMESLAPAAEGAGVSPLWDRFRHMVVPVLALSLPLAAMFERLQSQAMREVLGEPYIVAALARGVPRARVVWRGALKSALRPILSVYGLVAGTLLSGSFAVEVITSWPGLGRLMLDALRSRDLYLVAGCAAAASLFLAAGTLLSDAALAAADPRSRE